ncbi:MAG: signal peptidase II [Mycoplasmataceae bacterium]|nr:signal peptidase II [Mycoplasmataceae bacterium]
MINKYYNSLITYTKSHFEENKKLIVFNLFVFFGTIISLILIDQLTKTFLFTGKWEDGKLVADGITKLDIGVVGIRSVVNYGVTFIESIPTWLLHAFSIFIFIICGFFAFYSHDKLLIVAISFTFSGTFGNFLDRVMFDGAVKDIIFIPFLRDFNFLNGTFNFADVWLFAGSTISIIYIIIILYKNYQHNKF